MAQPSPTQRGRKDSPRRDAPAQYPGNGNRLREFIGFTIASTTILTALAFYFGWTLTNARSRYFGVDPSTLGFSTQDYVLRSTDALYVPLGAAILGALAAVAVHDVVTPRLRGARGTAARRTVLALAVIGGAVLVFGVAAVFWLPLTQIHYLLAPVSPGLGAALLAYAAYLSRSGLSDVAVTLVVLLAVMSAFWATSRYADALGRGRARALVASLAGQPSVSVYAKRRLFLEAPVVETKLIGRDTAYAFRYDGLRLLVRSGGKYFLVPDGWSRERGVVIVLADTDDLRFEFGVGP